MESLKYVIAGLKVRMWASGERTLSQSKDYLKDFDGEPDIIIEPDPESIEKVHQENLDLTYDEMEYLVTGWMFYRKFPRFDGLQIHSSCVVTDGKAYLFSAQSGTGKSTHTALWCDELGDKAMILNDDKPAVRLENGVFYAYGTPWSGKTAQNINAKYPVGGIAFIERSEKPFIEPAKTADAVRNLYWQTVKPRRRDDLDVLMPLCDKLIRSIPIYRFGANMEKESFIVSYEAMTGKKFGE